MTIANLSTSKLEEMETRNAKSISALKAWSNRNLSMAKRLSLITDLRTQQDAIITELMKREG